MSTPKERLKKIGEKYGVGAATASKTASPTKTTTQQAERSAAATPAAERLMAIGNKYLSGDYQKEKASAKVGVSYAQTLQQTEQKVARKAALEKERDRLRGELDALNATKYNLAATDRTYKARAEAGDTEENRKRAELEKQLDAVKREIQQVDYLDKYEGKRYEDNFPGQFAANKDLGRITQDLNAAYSDYLIRPTQANWQYVQALEQLTKDFQSRNSGALDDEGAVMPWLSKSAAGYIPQLVDQTKAQAAGAIVGGAAGSVIPVVGTVAGAKAGMVAASGIRSYNQMRGAAFRELLAAGMSEDAARAAANDEAILASLIEMADTGIDLATLGTGKLLTMLGAGGAKEVAGEAAEKAGKKLLKGLGKYGLNVSSEMLEEGAQQAISIANRQRTGTGTGDLLGSAIGVGTGALLGDDEQSRANTAEIMQAAGEGGKIAAMFGGTTMAATGAANAIMDNRAKAAKANAGDSKGAKTAEQRESIQSQQKPGQQPAAAETGGEQAKEQLKETAEESGPDYSNYPNLQKFVETGVMSDSTAVMAEVGQAVKDGVLKYEDGRTVSRQIAQRQRDKAAAQAELQKPETLPGDAETPATEPRAPGYHGSAEDPDAQYLDRLGKAAGVSVEKVPAAQAGNREGWIIGGRVYLSDGAEDVQRIVAKHEVTHHLQEMAPEAYNAFRDYVENIYRQRGTLGQQIEGLTNLYRENNQELTEEGALDELTANYAGELMDNENLIRRLAGEDRSLGQRILDAIREVLRRLRTAFSDQETRQLERAARLWEQALKETNAAYYQQGERNESQQVRNMYAGEKSATADLNALARAKEMDSQDVSAETIRQETGWFKGMDGKWRYEIDDSKMRYERRGDLGFRQRHEGYDRYRELNGKAEQAMLGLSDEQLTAEEQRELTELRGTWGNTFRADGKVTPEARPTTKLTDYIDHPELFAAYPELESASLVFDELPEGIRGQYDREQNTIRVSEKLRHAPQETLLHEIQHAVQQTEDFTGGASVEYWEDQQRAGRNKTRNEGAIKAANQRYRDLFDAAPEELRQTVRKINQAKMAGDWDAVLALGDEIYDGPYADIYSELGDADFDRRTLIEQNEPISAKELYRNTAGEIEARDTGKRRGLTADERKKTAPDLGGKDTVYAEASADSLDYVGKTADGTEVYETSEAVREMPYKQRMEAFLDVMRNEYSGRTAKFVADNDVYYAKFDEADLRKNVYGDKKSSPRGWKAKINTGADGNIFELVENSDYSRSGVERGKSAAAHKDLTGWEYFVKTVQIDGRVYDLLANVRKKPDGEYVYSIQLNENNNKAPAPPRQYQNDTAKAENRHVRVPTDAGITVAQERSSVKGARELQRQIDRLKKQNDRLREQMKLTDIPKANREAVEKQANELRKAYHSKIDKTELANRMERLYEHMAAKSSGRTTAPGNISWDSIRKEARAIADDVLGNVSVNVNPKVEEYADLRKELRGRKISLDARYHGDLASVGGYNELRKRSMGSLTLSKEGTPVDVVWQELSDRYPHLFPDDIVHPADQLIRMASIAQELKTVMGNPYEQNLENTAAYLAGEIEERFYDTPKQKPTIADQLARKYQEQRAKDQRLNADMLYNQQKAHERAIRDMEQLHKMENAARIERQSASERRETIRRHADRLGRKLIRPTDKSHVPAEMRGAALALVRYIDNESSYEMVYGPDAKYHRVQPGTELGAEITSRTAAARELQAEYKKLAEDATLTIDPDMDDYLDDIAEMGNKRVADMSRAELDTVWKVMQVIEHTIGQANELLEESRYRDLKDMANALKRENEGKKDRVNRAGALGNVDDLLNMDMLTPETYFRRLGKAGENIFRQMRRAADRQTKILKEGTDRARKMIEESGVSFAKADKEMHTFDLDGGKITLSTSQIMELYALSKREAALEHIYIGGLKPVEATVKGKIVGGSKPVQVTPGDVAEMVSTLTKEQRELVDGLQKYLSGDLAKHGNEESRKVYGYDKFLEKNYWPIKVSSTEVASDPGKAATAKTIPGYGMTKALKPNAKNAVELRSAIDTYSGHLNQMATYAAWLGTNENVTRLQNFKFETADGQPDGNVKQIIEKVYGKGGNDYLQNLLSDIAQGTKAGADKSFAEKGLSQFKAAKVGGNLRVIIQQPTAILRAMDMVDPKYFAAGKTTAGKGWEKAVKYAPIAQWKDWGYFEMDTGMSLRELMTGTENGLDKWKNRMMAPAGWADSVAWGHLWNAVEAETADTHPELQKGTEAFYQAVADRFSEVVDRTQVVDSVLHRSQIMRSSNYLSKVSTSFMSEPMKVYNMVVRDLYDLRGATNEAAKKQARKRLARTLAALVTSFAVNALAQSIVDGMRDDDREKKYLDKVADKWAENFAENFNPLGYIPYIKDAQSLVQGYTLERSEMEGVAELIASMQNLWKAVEGDSQKTALAAGLEAVSKLGDLIGLPVSNLRRDAEAIVRTVMIAAGASKLLYKWDKLTYNPEKAMGKFYDDLYRAMDTDQDTYEMIYEDVLEMLQEQGMDEDEAAGKIKSNVENRMKKELGLDKTSSLPIRYSAPGEDDVFDELMREAEADGGSWAETFGEETVEMARELDAMEDADKVKRVAQIGVMPFAEDVREDALESVLTATEWARYRAAKAGGVRLIDWCDFYESVKDERIYRTGKAGSESQEDVEAVLKRMPLTNSQRTAIWNSYGWKKDSPWS